MRADDEVTLFGSRASPRSTYRLQIRPSFTLDDAADLVDYLHELGVSWVYLSPILTATTGSDHGYDVVDPSRIDPARGGAEGLSRLSQAADAAGMGVLVDIVPNHMGVAVPRENPWWWDVLRRGRPSEFAATFDIDWEHGDGRVVVPILGAPLDDVLARGELTVDRASCPDAPDGVLRYFDHVLPLAAGSAEASDLSALLAAQHYRLCFWREESTDLNYRRFFGVSTLAAVRVESDEVFEATHREILRWLREGLVDGLRVDHVDGLRDPTGYLDALARATGGAYVVVEKILEHGEELPSWWQVAGTTGYDALAPLDRVLTDPEGQGPLNALDARLRKETGLSPRQEWPDLIHDTKRMIADTLQQSEIRRLVAELPNATARTGDALAELVACFPVYRSFLPAGLEHLKVAASEAIRRRPDLRTDIEQILPVLSDPRSPAALRFPQTTGPVMAKGVEDTAFYRATQLGSLTEVGGDPSVFSITVDAFHDAQQRRRAAWPHTMTTLSTHDTKRSEDVRARLAVLAEIPDRWAAVLTELRAAASSGHGPFDALLWQAIIGAWPASSERLHAFALKAAREAAVKTEWTDPNAAFEDAVAAVVETACHATPEILSSFVDEITPFGWSNGLSAKLLQLAGPGVPDVYQGSELWDLSLVDPDNRRPVDLALRRRMLADLDRDLARGALPPVDASGAAKLLVTSRTLRLRRDRPELFTRYRPLLAVGEASGHAIAADRGGATAVATRLPVALARVGGWGDTILMLRDVAVRDAFTGRRFPGGQVALAEVLADYPVALLVEER